jgi:hypothetical protein
MALLAQKIVPVQPRAAAVHNDLFIACIVELFQRHHTSGQRETKEIFTFLGLIQGKEYPKSVYLAVTKTVLDAETYFRWNKSHDQS